MTFTRYLTQTAPYFKGSQRSTDILNPASVFSLPPLEAQTHCGHFQTVYFLPGPPSSRVRSGMQVGSTIHGTAGTVSGNARQQMGL